MGIVQRQSIKTSIITYGGLLLAYINFNYLCPKYLAPEEFGLTRLLLNVAVPFSQFALLGISFTLLRFFPYFNNKQEKHYGILSYALLVSLAGYVAIGILFLIFKEQVSDFFRQKSQLFTDNYWYIYPLAFFLMAFEVMFFYARSLYKTVVPIFIKEVVLRLFQTAAIVLYVLKLVDFQGFLWAFYASYLIHYIVIIVYLAYLKQLFLVAPIRLNEKLPRRQLNRYGIFVYTVSIAAIYTTYIDSIMLGHFLGLKEIAVYSIAMNIGTLVIIPSRTMNQVAIPIITEAWKNNNLSKIKELYQQTAINQFIVGGFILLMLWINADLLLSFLPAIYSSAKWPILIIGFARLIDMSCGANGEIILFSKHVKFNLATNVLLIIISTMALYILIPRYGVMGAAVSVPIAYIVYNAVRVLFLFVTYRMQPFTFNNLKVLIIFTTLLGVTFFVPQDMNIWVKSVGTSLIIGVLFVLANLSLRTSNEIALVYHVLKSRLRDFLT